MSGGPALTPPVSPEGSNQVVSREWDGRGNFEQWCAWTLLKLAEAERINPDKYEGFDGGDLEPVTDDEEEEFGPPGGAMSTFGGGPAVAWQPNEIDALPGTPIASNPLSDTLPGTPLTQEEPPPMPGASGSRPGSRRASQREEDEAEGMITPLRQGGSRRGSRRGSATETATPLEAGVQEVLCVKVVRGVRLLNISQDIGWTKGTSDPCVKAELIKADGEAIAPEGDAFSPRVDDSLNPEFNHTFAFPIDRAMLQPGPGGSTLRLTILDDNSDSAFGNAHEAMGQVELPLSEVAGGGLMDPIPLGPGDDKGSIVIETSRQVKPAEGGGQAFQTPAAIPPGMRLRPAPRAGTEHWPAKHQRITWLWAARQAWEQEWLRWEGVELLRNIEEWREFTRRMLIIRKVMAKFKHIELAIGLEAWQNWWVERLDYLDDLARILAKMKNSGLVRCQNHWIMMSYLWREQKELKQHGRMCKERRDKTIHFKR